MSVLEKRAAGDWFEIRERWRHPDELFEHLCPPGGPRRALQEEVISAAARTLEQAVEGGVFEARRRLLGDLLSELAEAEFSSEVFTRLDELACRATALVVVGALQRAFLARDVALGRGAGEAEATGSSEKKDVEQAEINEIIADIKEIVATDPGARMNAAIKNVLLQVQKYRDEAATFQKLKEQATDYRLEMYTKTFSATFQQIFESIRKNYGAYLEEQEAKRRDAVGSPLDGVETKGWLRALGDDLEDVSWVRSTLLVARDEAGGMRGAVVALSKKRDQFLARIDAEREAAVAACGDEETAVRVSRLLSREVAAWLRKALEARGAGGSGPAGGAGPAGGSGPAGGAGPGPAGGAL